jgi:hypothetical protein
MHFTFHIEKPIESTLNQDNLYLTIAILDHDWFQHTSY